MGIGGQCVRHAERRCSEALFGLDWPTSAAAQHPGVPFATSHAAKNASAMVYRF
jgi:hypothetical protein